MSRNPVTCKVDDDCAKVARLLRDNDCGSLPVVTSEANQVIGMITDRDICCRVAAEDKRASDVNVRDAMSTKAVTVREDEDVDQAVIKMEQCQIRRIPVVDASGGCVGVIAQADVALASETKSRVGEVVEQVSRPRAA
jgi:CBS domain-containing protein